MTQTNATPLQRTEDAATCRGCNRVLIGKAYHLAGSGAYHPVTNERCPANFYGGWVCSESCDRRASLELERSMPGHSRAQTRLSSPAEESVRRHWSTR